MEYLYVSWKDMQHAVENALQQLEHPVKGIIAITRGGMIPAGFIAQQAHIKNVKIVSLESYADSSNTQGNIRVISPLPPADELDQYIFVDDIVDSGNTIRYLKQKYPNIKHMVLFAKPKSADLVDYCGRILTEQESSKWLIFPWYTEFLESKTYTDTP